MQARLIAIDMDGTLLRSDGSVSPRTLQALLAADRAGIEVVMSTGRRHSYAMRVLRPLNLNPASALVSSNGTVVRTIGSELLQRTYLPRSTARWLCGHMREFRDTLVLTFDTVGPDGEDSRGALVVEQLAELNKNINAWIRSNEPYIVQVAPIEFALENAPPIQMMLCGPIARMRQAEARLLEHEGVAAVDTAPGAALQDSEVALHRTEYPGKDLCILDILPGGVSKASALLFLARHRGITPAEIVAIGDNWNDAAMLDLAGHAVLMANAPADLRALAATRGWQLGVSNDDDGVALAIEAVLRPNHASRLLPQT